MSGLDLSKMTPKQLCELQRKISEEVNQRNDQTQESKKKKAKEFLASDEGRQIKSEIQSLQFEFTGLPKKIDLQRTVTLKLSAEQNGHDSVTEILEEGEDHLGFLTFELVDDPTLPKDVKESLESQVADIGYEYFPVEDALLEDSFDGRRWIEFNKRIKDLDGRLNVLYDAGLDLDDLMDS